MLELRRGRRFVAGRNPADQCLLSSRLCFFPKALAEVRREEDERNAALRKALNEKAGPKAAYTQFERNKLTTPLYKAMTLSREGRKIKRGRCGLVNQDCECCHVFSVPRGGTAGVVPFVGDGVEKRSEHVARTPLRGLSLEAVRRKRVFFGACGELVYLGQWFHA